MTPRWNRWAIIGKRKSDGQIEPVDVNTEVQDALRTVLHEMFGDGTGQVHAFVTNWPQNEQPPLIVNPTPLNVPSPMTVTGAVDATVKNWPAMWPTTQPVSGAVTAQAPAMTQALNTQVTVLGTSTPIAPARTAPRRLFLRNVGAITVFLGIGAPAALNTFTLFPGERIELETRQAVNGIVVLGLTPAVIAVLDLTA